MSLLDWLRPNLLFILGVGFDGWSVEIFNFYQLRLLLLVHCWLFCLSLALFLVLFLQFDGDLQISSYFDDFMVSWKIFGLQKAHSFRLLERPFPIDTPALFELPPFLGEGLSFLRVLIQDLDKPECNFSEASD